MSLYLRIKPNGQLHYPYSLGMLKFDFPHMSFSEHIDQVLLNQLGIYPVIPESHANTFGKLYSELEPEYIDGKYYQRWKETDDDPVRIEMFREQKWNEIKQTRNALLRDSDFTMLEDFPDRGKSLLLWKKYRQELRDITKQEDPFHIVWPVKPQ